MESVTMTAPATTKPTVVELFAGAGGMMLGLENAGFQTLVANEIHAHPCMTMRRNFPDVPIVEGSIRDFSAAQLFEQAGYDSIPDVDLVAGGPPCQGFSTAGMKDPADPRNTLIGDYVRIVSEIRPRAFLLENVTGLLTMKGGKLWENVADQLSGLGYNFHYSILHAADYGVPQMRKRLIVLGSREEAPPRHPLPTHGPTSSDANALFDIAMIPHVSVGDAIADLPEIEQGTTAVMYSGRARTAYQKRMREGAGKQLRNHVATRHREATAAYYGLIPPGGTALDVPKELRNGKQGIQRWPVGGLSRTITTEPTDFLHPKLNRIPTIRELARIQSFPDRFEFMGQRTTGNKMRRLGYCSQSQQVGNAVPPILAEAIGRSIIDGWR
jgi:DNA (cytosine-5)-methyltransferase 1